MSQPVGLGHCTSIYHSFCPLSYVCEMIWSVPMLIWGCSAGRIANNVSSQQSGVCRTAYVRNLHPRVECTSTLVAPATSQVCNILCRDVLQGCHLTCMLQAFCLYLGDDCLSYCCVPVLWLGAAWQLAVYHLHCCSVLSRPYSCPGCWTWACSPGHLLCGHQTLCSLHHKMTLLCCTTTCNCLPATSLQHDTMHQSPWLPKTYISSSIHPVSEPFQQSLMVSNCEKAGMYLASDR